MRAIIASRADPISMRVAEILINSYGFEEVGVGLFRRRGGALLKIIEEKHVEANGLAEDLRPELAIVASSHKSEAGIRALLAHPAGNWGDEAPAGGLPRTLSPTSASALYISLHALSEAASELKLNQWSMGLEVTHHGPATSIPLIFIEAGGPLGEIPEERALEAVAHACVTVAESEAEAPLPAVGFGGGHYAPRFTRLTLDGEYSFGHMCPRYAMPIGRDMVIQAFERTIEFSR